jgi:tetratricopeptide (TPR) repeat protein
MIYYLEFFFDILRKNFTFASCEISHNLKTMSKKQVAEHESGFETVEHALTRSEQYIEENKKSLTIIIAAIIIVVGGYLGYKKMILGPKEVEAQSQAFRAEQYFKVDSFKVALEGDGDALGFADIIDEYGMTETANLCHYYAGICYLRLGDYEKAIENLKSFDSNDRLISVIAIGAIGDAYSEMSKFDKAVTFYEKAANKNKNAFTSAIYLKKAGLVYEKLDNNKKALSAYEKIKKDYPASDEARDIEKYIQSVKMKI